MAGPASRIRELTEHALHASEPGVALRAITALRQELETFEQLQVARALEAGETFAGIARTLHISRQAAHRRYRDLVGVALPDPGDEAQPARGRVIVTSEARTAVNLAREEASGLGAGVVGTEHLLLGIIRSGEPSAADVLRELGVTLEEARRCAQPTLVDGAPPPAAPPAAPIAPGPRGISAYARAVFEQSLREAVARGDGYIGVDHLLLAAVAEADGGAARTLHALGVQPDAVRAAMAAA
jgi:hypothetical protein